MADTTMPLYLPYPRFLFKMEISQTAKLLYSLLLDRSTLSQKNKWQDDKGRIYIIYPIAEPAICESAACATGTVFRPTDGRKTDPHRAGKPTN